MAKAVKSDSIWAGRVPPQNIDAERSVLGAMMLDEESRFKALELLKPEHFYSPGHGVIFEAIRVLFHEENTPADLIVVTNRLKDRGELDKVGGAGYLSGLVNVVPTVENAEHYAKIVRDKSFLRECIKTASKLAEWSYSQELELDEIIENTFTEFLELSQRREERDFATMIDLAPNAYDTIRKLQTDGETDFLPTGYFDFDNTYHGFHSGEYVIIAARPSVGKTSWALNITTNLAREGKRIALFSLEMPKEQLVMRLISGLANVPASDITSGNITGTQLEHIKATTGLIKDWGIFIDDTPSLTPIAIRTKLKRLILEQSGNIDLAIIDYMQLLFSDKGNRSENRAVEVSQMSRSLKALAREVDVPVVVLSQLSRHIERREGESRAPMLSDLRESGAIEQDADKVIFLQRVKDAQKITNNTFEWKHQVYTIPADDEFSLPIPVYLYVAKNRNGPTGQMLLGFNRETMKFSEYTVRTPVLERNR